MSYQEKIDAYRNAIESVLLDDEYRIDQKISTLEVLFADLRVAEHGLETKQMADRFVSEHEEEKANESCQQ